MAIYNEILTGRYARMLQKLLGMKGPVPTKQLAGEVMAILNLFSGAENRYLEGWDRFAFTALIPAAAGFNSVLALRNALNSNVIAVFEKITFTATAAAGNPTVQNSHPSSGDFGTAIGNVGQRLDGRGRPNPSLIASSQNTSVFTTGITFWIGAMPLNQSVDVIVDENQEIPLLPGEAIVLREAQLNVAMEVAVMWRERFLEESERS